MFSHIMIGSNDLERSKKFYDAALGELGFSGDAIPNSSPSGHQRLIYMHNGGMLVISQPINNEPATPANGGTIGFACTSPEQVKSLHDACVANGGTSIEDPPGLRDIPGMGQLHLSYMRDPDGHKLCGFYSPG